MIYIYHTSYTPGNMDREFLQSNHKLLYYGRCSLPKSSSTKGFFVFLGTFLGSEVKRSFQMDVIKDLLAAISGVLNGLPQGLLAMTFGFASVPTAIAFVIGAFGNTFTSNVAVISFQAETITVAGIMRKNIRERLSMIFFGALIMLVIGLFGLMELLLHGLDQSLLTV